MNDTFLKACRGEKVDYTPVWIMRQAGRYLPEYQKIRSKVDFLTLCKTPELAAEVTIQPVDILNIDAAILFSDILVPLEPMGMQLEFHEKQGPVLSNPVRDYDAVEKLVDLEPMDDVPYVMQTIEILSKELSNKVPLIGFAGAPFTLATYMIEGGSSKNFVNTKKMMYQDPLTFQMLMKKLTHSVIAYLLAQIHSGAQAVQIFDSWAGILSPYDYKTKVLDFVKHLVTVVKNSGVPVIYFVNNCAGILHLAKEAGSQVMGVDWRIDMEDAVDLIGGGISVQGNLDPCILFSKRDQIEKNAKMVLEKASEADGHIFNLGHGILPETPVDNAKALVDVVHTMSTDNY